MIKMIANVKLKDNFNTLSARGKKTSVQRYIKRNYNLTTAEYIEKYVNGIVPSDYCCNICNTFSKNTEYDFVVKDNMLYLKLLSLPNDLVLCKGDESITATKCKQDRKGINPNSVEFMKLCYDVNGDEARQLIHSRNSSPFYRSNHKSAEAYAFNQRRTRDWFETYKTAEDYDKYREKLKYTHSKQYYIDTLGDEDGSARWKEMSQQKASCNLEAKVKRYGKVLGEKLYSEHVNASRQTLGKFISRYGKEEGQRQWEEYTTKSPFYNKEKNKMCIEYWIKNGYENPEYARKEFITSRPVFTKQSCIEKYGLSSGIERYKLYCKRQAEAIGRNCASKESLDNFYNKLVKMLPTDIEICIGAHGKKEYFIMDSNYGYRLYDFTIPEINVIIEYHGSFWHYNKNNLMESKFSTLKERKEKDKIKREVAEKHGFEYYVVFDTANFDDEVKKYTQLIMEKYNECRN
jgi:hypothetical protein